MIAIAKPLIQTVFPDDRKLIDRPIKIAENT
jgi:hypothetical protein